MTLLLDYSMKLRKVTFPDPEVAVMCHVGKKEEISLADILGCVALGQPLPLSGLRFPGL